MASPECIELTFEVYWKSTVRNVLKVVSEKVGIDMKYLKLVSVKDQASGRSLWSWSSRFKMEL